jgi:hypothetical protein
LTWGGREDVVEGLSKLTFTSGGSEEFAGLVSPSSPSKPEAIPSHGADEEDAIRHKFTRLSDPPLQRIGVRSHGQRRREITWWSTGHGKDCICNSRSNDYAPQELSMVSSVNEYPKFLFFDHHHMLPRSSVYLDWNPHL